MANKATNAEKRQRDGFFSGVLLLSASTMLVKVIGLACKIPLIAVLGAEGMGYFNSAFEIFALLCTLATTGFPVAMSVLISAARQKGREDEIAKIYRTSTRFLFALGAIGSLLMLFFSRPIAVAIGNDDASFCIVAISPALLCVCLSCAIRGYFQGYDRMGPTAVSQLIEAVGKLCFGVLFAAIAIQNEKNVAVAAAYSVLGLTIGTLLSTLYLWVLKIARGKRRPKGYLSDAKGSATLMPLLRMAFPITVSAALLGFARMIDMALILRRLSDIGTSLSRANEIYGSYTTLALPVFGLVPALITPVALSLVPRLSAAVEAKSKDGQHRVVTDALRLTVVPAMPASLGIALYSTPILTILFSSEPEAVSIAAPLLSVLGGSVFFSCMITTTNAILQAYRKPNLPIISTAIGVGIKIFSAYVLIGAPSIGIYGAPLSTFLCNLTVTLINLWFVYGVVERTEHAFSLYARPLVASLGAMLCSFCAYLPVSRITQSTTLGFLAALPVAGISYLLLAFLIGAITKDDVAMLPRGKNRSKPTHSRTIAKSGDGKK